MEVVEVKAPRERQGTPPWEDAGWLDEAQTWIDDQLKANGLRRTATPAARARMWSVVARVEAVPDDAPDAPSTTGAANQRTTIPGAQTLWFKANPPGSAFEPKLIKALNAWAPEFVPVQLAADPARAWQLMRHVGPPLSETLLHTPGPLRLTPVVHEYARLQTELADRCPELLRLGLPDLRPELLTARFEALLEDPRIRRAPATATEPGIITADQLKSLDAFAPELLRRARELADYGIPATLDHNDLHPNNMLSTGPRTRVIDWGDASVAHPFTTLLTLLRSCTQYLTAAGRAAVREAYLRPWEALGIPRDDLDRAVELAVGLAPVSRALVWRRVFPCFADAPDPHLLAAGWLARLLADDPLTVGLDVPL